ncbi:MFS transporter [Saccharothrix sp. ST-888]|uniref:MFS transporter n=1 Tax=Saccharothrix sp. ST-888 TaxID=1427391 RepID=UPI0005ECC57C|nr:MFS transporter [Saccharothrix sp. ST-888]KJK59118.1 major facilitator transporter [Saccharothrix sp. ST-888]
MQPRATPAAAGPAWSPLREKVFRALWLAQFVSNVGGWVQTVGAQWLLVGHGPALVSLVQVAAGLPVLLLALPAGVLADLVDRRRLLLGLQAAMAAAAAVLTALALLGTLGVWSLLLLTFLLGCLTALGGPAWQALQPSLVPREQLRQASALGAVNMNLARAAGPALGGALVAAAGVDWTFAVNAVSFLGILLVLLRWRPTAQTPRRGQEREHALAALRAGGRYVRNAPSVRRILLRSALFVPGAAALWALLPVAAVQRLGLGPSGYGVLLGAVGLGAVLGAAALPRLGARLGATGMLALAGTLTAGALLVVAVSRDATSAGAALAVAGAAWIWGLSTLSAALQLEVPNWVRARAVACYLLVFQGGNALGALVWGQLAQRAGLTAALAVPAGLLLLGVVSLRGLPLLNGRADPALSDTWPEPRLTVEPAPQDGPVLVTATYRVAVPDAPDFTRAMAAIEASRRRTGAIGWGLYRDAAAPERFTEVFTVSSWAEHRAQHHDRYTGIDHEFERTARRFAAEDPVVTHAVAARPQGL